MWPWSMCERCENRDGSAYQTSSAG
jgi:hypothetical protein